MPALSQALAVGRTVLLGAPPGSGKTTRVPLALAPQAWLTGRQILMLEPRRIAARAAAAHMSRLGGTALGGEVGYSVRFERRVSAHTRIHVVTEGILTRRLQSDPELRGVGLVIFDEFHERSLDTDLGLALCLDVQQGLRPDLRILIMSATLDRDALAGLLPEAAILEAAGRQHPVEIRHRPGNRDHSTEAQARSALGALLDEHPGDALVFLPGTREIQRLCKALEGTRQGTEMAVVPLHGTLGAAAQDRALNPDPAGRRRVVVSTNIAESSLTLDGIRLVVDSGLARRPRFDPNTGLDRLDTVAISRASATQRAGRAGRQGCGVCVRLWSAEDHAGRAAHDPPAIRDSDLSRLVLELAVWGVTDPGRLRFPEPPPRAAVEQARELLRSLGALDAQGRILARGRAMAALPTHPRLAAMLVSAGSGPQRALACDLAALLDAPELFTREAILDHGLGADLAHRLHALGASPAAGRVPAGVRGASLDHARRGARQLRRRLGVASGETAAGEAHAGELLLHAYPDRLAQRRPDSASRYLLRSGRGAGLPDGDALGACRYIVVPELDAGRREGRIFRAAAVDEDAVQRVLGGQLESLEEVAWDPRERRVRCSRQRRLGALVLERREAPAPDPEAVLQAMLEGIGQLGIECLPWDEETRQLQARSECLRRWCAPEPWPRMDDQALLSELRDWLSPWLTGIRQAAQLRGLPLADALAGRIPAPLRPRLAHWAPTHLRVPSGSRVRLHYDQAGAPPVLAVKLQEMFGQLDTPTVCDGRVPVMVHLLSPARRPVQITQDLAGFWLTGYPQVRKELRGRYPRHPWPEDPMAATATRAARPRARG